MENNKNILNNDPLVYTLDNFFTKQECEHVISLAKGNMKRATVSTSKKGEYSKGRTGSNCWIPHNHDRTMMSIALRISKVVGLPITHAEQFQVIHYDETQEYSAHYDSYELEDDNEKSIRCLRMGGQRLWTALGYLNTPEEGGHTEFIKLKKNVPAKMGKLLVFQDYKEEKNPNTNEIYYHMHLDTLHAGTPVVKGEKWGFNLWFRQKPLTEFFDLRNLFKNKPRQIQEPSDNALKIGLPEKFGEGEVVKTKLEQTPYIVMYQNALNRQDVTTVLHHSRLKNTNEKFKHFYMNNNIHSLLPVVQKISNILKIPYQFFENFQVTLHKNGNFSKLRSFDIETKRDLNLAGIRGQQMFTVMAALNNNFRGGTVSFQQLSQKCQLLPGNILLIKNTTNKNIIDDKSDYFIEKIHNGHLILLEFNIREFTFNKQSIHTLLDDIIEPAKSFQQQLNMIYEDLDKKVEMKPKESLTFDCYKIDWNFRYQLLNKWKNHKLKHGGYLFNKNLLDKDFGYSEMTPVKINKNVFNKQILKSIQTYYDTCFAKDKIPFGDGQATRWRAYNESISRIIHYELLELFEHITKHKLKPTYTYMSAYKGETDLKPHTDRDQCQYTVSFIFNKTPKNLKWPIYWDKEKQKIPNQGRAKYTPMKTNCLSFDTDIGGLIIFQGMDHIHFRETLKENERFYTLLLHYNRV